jgi:hypothetical protein
MTSTWYRLGVQIRGERIDYSGKYVEVGFIKGFVVTGPSFRSLHIDIEAGVG